MVETQWVKVEKLASSHSKITPKQMKSGEKIPPVKSEKVWVEGEVVYESDERVTIDNGEEHFTVEKRLAREKEPPVGKTESLE